MTTFTKLIPNRVYEELASDEQIERTAKALEDHGIHTIVVANGDEARAKVFELLPAEAEVFNATSRTLESLGIPAEINARYSSVRAKTAHLDRKTQRREITKLTAIPEYMLGSVQAVTEDGQVVMASYGGSQLAGYAVGAGHVLWVVGAQKIVPNLEEGLKRVREYSYPLEDERLLQAYGIYSGINKLLIISREAVPGRITMIIVKERLGF
jgi:L-lactate utilization protein LutC